MTRAMAAKPAQAVFNLIDEPWLPVRRRSGGVEHIQPWRINERIGEDPFVAFAWPRTHLSVTVPPPNVRAEAVKSIVGSIGRDVRQPASALDLSRTGVPPRHRATPVDAV